jgi:sugar phosphate isomerase/epimerase
VTAAIDTHRNPLETLMQVILNIGLDGVPVNGETYTNGKRNPQDVEQLMAALQAARSFGFEVRDAALRLSASEPTAVLSCSTAMTAVAARAHALAQHLNQDCIAVYDPARQHGELIGPNAEKWGAFNPAFFLQLDGTRLA